MGRRLLTRKNRTAGFLHAVAVDADQEEREGSRLLLFFQKPPQTTRQPPGCAARFWTVKASSISFGSHPLIPGIMADEGKTKIEKFDGTDIGWWKMQIEDLLCQKDLDQTLIGTRPEKTSVADWAALDRKAMAAIRLSLSKNVAFNILKETTACGIMQALTNMYEKSSAANKVFLIRELVNTKMREGGSVTAHINNFNTIISRLVSVDIKFDDEVQALLLLSSLPESWSGTVTAERILESSGESSSSLLSTESRGRRTDRGHSRSRSKSRKKGQSKPRKDITCWNCKENGHFKSQCPKPILTREKKEVNAAIECSEDEALICCVENTTESWIMDSSVSFHATFSTKRMKNLKTGNFGKVCLANNQTLDIIGKGDIDLRTSLGTIWTLTDVRVIPDLRKMLISIGKLDDEGLDVHFGGGQWKVVKGNLVISRGKKRGSLYMVEDSAGDVNAVTSGPSLSSLWHQGLGHMSEKGLKILADKGKFPDLKKVELDDTFCGSNYYVTFIDDATRKVGVYFLKNKFEVFDVFKKWKAAVEMETNLKVKCLKSDNGGEYISTEFVNYCADRGIKMIKTVPRTSQQNGIAERMNRTINERARSMRLNAGLPKTFWANAVNTAAYLINRGPSVPLGFKIPEEEWLGREVTIKHLKVFGCDAYVGIKDFERDKLDPKAKRCTFIGCGAKNMGYRLWDAQSKKILRSRDHVFNEAKLYKDKDITVPETHKEHTEFDEESQKETESQEEEGPDQDDWKKMRISLIVGVQILLLNSPHESQRQYLMWNPILPSIGRQQQQPELAFLISRLLLVDYYCPGRTEQQDFYMLLLLTLTRKKGKAADCCYSSRNRRRPPGSRLVVQPDSGQLKLLQSGPILQFWVFHWVC
ncbi:hypothetical protein E3N88_04073 [Mikania micrantha]|uniref:Integrase catalytic domain-containing protein n=1 Tax=Mikania micrantha TaxID=192012 RepID=A0A5N6PTD0_9ASTR|nr:hypothetical protein E3N88_04073 [Mikania micrantha]